MNTTQHKLLPSSFTLQVQIVLFTPEIQISFPQQVQTSRLNETLKTTETSAPLQQYWKIENTNFGVILKGLEGDTMLPPGMFEDLVTKLESHKKGKIIFHFKHYFYLPYHKIKQKYH